VTTWLGSTQVSNATLMRINSDLDDTEPELAYVIVDGVVRDIVHGEPEWSNELPTAQHLRSCCYNVAC